MVEDKKLKVRSKAKLKQVQARGEIVRFDELGIAEVTLDMAKYLVSLPDCFCLVSSKGADIAPHVAKSVFQADKRTTKAKCLENSTTGGDSCGSSGCDKCPD